MIEYRIVGGDRKTKPNVIDDDIVINENSLEIAQRLLSQYKRVFQGAKIEKREVGEWNDI